MSLRGSGLRGNARDAIPDDSPNTVAYTTGRYLAASPTRCLLGEMRELLLILPEPA